MRTLQYSLAAALLVSGGLMATPAFAATSDQAQDAANLVNNATQTVGKIKADSRFEGLLKKSKGVFIMPSLTKGAFIVGGEGAQGVLLKHNSDGSWSDPAFLSLGSISIGAQAGGKSGPAAMILMTDKALNDFTQANNFSLNANAGLTVVNYSANGQAPIGKGDIVVWSDQSGAFAGGSVNGADLTQNKTEDHQYYGTSVDAQQIVNGKQVSQKAEDLRNALPS